MLVIMVVMLVIMVVMMVVVMLVITVCELTVCNVQFAHRFGQNGENCTSLFQTMCKKIDKHFMFTN